MFRSLALIALVTVLSALAACTASNYWADWDRLSDAAPSQADAIAPASASHVVARGETAYSIARTYGVSVSALAAANDMGASFVIREGQSLQIPGPQTSVAEAAPVPKPAMFAQRNGAGHRALIWPVSGPVISTYGLKDDGRFNEGVNIAAARGTPVSAAADGIVTYAGNEIRGYGNLILIRHAGGLVTAYAHNEKLKVKKGVRVRQGDIVALSGATGTVAMPQVHFEVRRAGKTIDPVPVLDGGSDVAAR